MAKYRLYTDGSYRKHLSLAGIGGHLIDENDNVLFKFSEKIPESESLKHHESIAMLHGLTKALEHGIKELECFSDDINIAKAFESKEFNSQAINAILKDPCD